MFNIGDKVVYPMHGAGVIESIEEKEILGKTQKYFVMRMPIGNMKLMIPMKSIGDIGLREIVDNNTVVRVLDRLRVTEDEDTTNWNKRYRTNLSKIKTGDIYEVADVVRSLMLRDEEKGLSSGERKMLENAKQILISELALAKGLQEEQAFELLDDSVLEKNN